MKNKNVKSVLSLTGYLLLVFALCFSASLVFHNLYYDLIYVSGGSMYPTLNKHISSSEENTDKEGALVDFGIMDTHASAINHISRFDIVSTYYPLNDNYKDDYNADGSLKNSAKMKIKRVIALPNETFTIQDGLLSVKKGDEFVKIPYPFKINLSSIHKNDKDVNEKTLGENEYWVLGDNRDSSKDCGYMNFPIYKENLVGVLVAIEGQAKLKLKTSSAYVEYDLVNKQYHWPQYF